MMILTIKILLKSVDTVKHFKFNELDHHIYAQIYCISIEKKKTYAHSKCILKRQHKE